MVDLIIKNKFKGISVISSKKGGNTMKRAVTFKNWVF